MKCAEYPIRPSNSFEQSNNGFDFERPVCLGGRCLFSGGNICPDQSTHTCSIRMLSYQQPLNPSCQNCVTTIPATSRALQGSFMYHCRSQNYIHIFPLTIIIGIVINFILVSSACLPVNHSVSLSIPLSVCLTIIDIIKVREK
jgi:hypothetical protein